MYCTNCGFIAEVISRPTGESYVKTEKIKRTMHKNMRRKYAHNIRSNSR